MIRLAVLSMFLFSGCTVLRPTTACEQMDWYAIGRNDGAQGKTLETLPAHQQSCGESFTDLAEAVYLNGRNAGLVEYCAPQNGFAMGRMGIAYTLVCPSTMETNFLVQLEKGKKARALEQENAELNARMDAIFMQLPQSDSQQEKDQLNSQLRDIRQLRAKNRKELSNITVISN